MLWTSALHFRPRLQAQGHFSTEYCERDIVREEESSKEMGFYNPRSHLDSTAMTYCPHAAKNGEDR